MTRRTSRRAFIGAGAVAGAAMGLETPTWLASLPVVSAGEVSPRPESVQFRSEIEPIVRLLEDTPRERLLEEVAQRIRRGLSYQEVVAALLLAGVRNVQPRPSVGFKFHAVLVVNSAHLASLASPDADRWLPIFWALDYFKEAQARDTREGNWTMQPVDESAVPPASEAQASFVAAMESWDESAADAAVVGLARSAGANEVLELFYRYGCRDFRSIGHKAIFVSNAKRTLDCIGWRHAEPVLRSLAYALLNHQGEPNPAQNDLKPDQPGRSNAERIRKIRAGWLNGSLDDGATTETLNVLREGSSDECCDQVVSLLNRGVSPRSIWNALLCGAGELLMRQPGIVALHAVTSSNALRYAYATSGVDDVRKMLLLQNAAFLPLFREEMRRRGSVGTQKVDQLEARETSETGSNAIAEIFSDLSRDRNLAAGKVLRYLSAAPAEPLIDAARRLIFLKGTDSHDYKFSSAVLEDYYSLSPKWRNRYLATAMFNLRGSESRDNGLAERTRVALQA
jgi:hypothetical protein